MAHIDHPDRAATSDDATPGSDDRRRFLQQSGASVGVAAAQLAVPASLAHAAAFAGLAPRSVIAHTSAGAVRGTIDQGVNVFKRVRYGSDTAHRRFMPPLPPDRWISVQDATVYGPACPQSGSMKEPSSEDCLFLNVWTPGLRDRGSRPVLLYIHGGAYSHGSSSSPLYDGTRLCRRGDVVVVTVNHRLDAFGYLYLARLGGPELGDSGNAGQLDLVLALQWVRDNIAEFGGDPTRVMLFGQSGGGAKIATLMAMPAAQGLFRRAATMSGQQLTASGPLHATERARAFLSALQLSGEHVDLLRELPAERLVEALETVDPIIGEGALYFGPVLDERSLRRHPFYPDAPPNSTGVPMIIGNTHDETRNLIGAAHPQTFALSWEQLPQELADNMRVDIAPEFVVAEYRKLHPQASPSDIFFSATTASRSWRSAIVEAELRARQGSPAYVYQLDWKSPKDGGKWGAPHALDIPLVFDNLDKEGSITGTGAGAQRMADRMSEAFLAFARTGDPNNRGLPRWEPYQLPRRQTMVLDESSRLVDDPRGPERRLFAKVPFTQQGT
ncbi:MAG TPA: carboxylesterase/lipase family protein [Steroidobacteraceae bacterium]